MANGVADTSPFSKLVFVHPFCKIVVDNEHNLDTEAYYIALLVCINSINNNS